jgi:hypothetical protein
VFVTKFVDQFDEWPLNKKQKGLQMNRESEVKIVLKKNAKLFRGFKKKRKKK